MRTAKIFGLATFAGLMAIAPLHADQWDKKTVITIDAPVQIPTAVLQPGTYTLKLMESSSNRHIVTVWDKDGMHLVTTVLAIPNYRLQPTGDSKFTFWETPANQTKALRAWFYPGDNFGQEFAYPKGMALEIAKANNNAEVPSLTKTEEDKYSSTTTTAAAVTPEPTPAPEPVAAEPTPAPAKPEPAPVAAEPEPTPAPAAPAPTPEPTPQAATPAPTPVPQESQPADTMPKTASHWVEIFVIGILAAVTGLSTFRRGRQA